VRLLFVWILMWTLSVGVVSPDDQTAQLRERALLLVSQEKLEEGLDYATRAIRSNRRNADLWLLRADILDSLGRTSRAAADYGEAIRLDARSDRAWQRRGEFHFRHGRLAESIADFDRVLEISPEKKPHHWQRGIALYLAGRYSDGKAQFELHQTVNPQDVENAVWHFLCTARAEGLESARKKLIPIEGDSRVPMAQVHRLFAGKGTVEEVSAAAEAVGERTPSAKFYADLYLGLFFEAIGDEKAAKLRIGSAAARARSNGYMGDVAVVHAALLQKQAKGKQPKPSSPSSGPAGKSGSSRSPTRL
jgi:lipoprotein NlpI